MVVSASRRCDIPAFAGDWFMERLRSGEVEVANPFRPSPGRRVSLRREDVDAFVFWSRDPRPFLGHLPEIERGGYAYYFLLTVTGYPAILEPCTPEPEAAAFFFRELAARIGRQRVIWRYDPVIFTQETDFGFHADNFSRLAGLLSPFTSRVIVSFFDPYPKVGRRLQKAGIRFEAASGSPEQQLDLLGREAALPVGVSPGKCVDEGLLNDLFGLGLAYRKDPAQRKLCLCQQSVDIGSYGACGHGCVYCYAR
jgi:hypothetical protein